MRRIRVSLASLATAGLVAALLVAAPSAASGHGYVSGDVVARAAASQNTNRGTVAYEPQSLEGPKGFPEGGPADGQLASAGGLFGGTLDEQSEDRWWKNEVTTGDLTITWTFTAAHRTSEFRYYITTPGWDANDPLDRGDFVLLATVPHDGSAASTNPSHTVTIPADYSGYHVIYAVWDIADTSNAFYNTIDLSITPADGSPTPTPTVEPTPEPTESEEPAVAAVTGLHIMERSDTTMQLMWTSSADAASYRVSRTAPNGTVTTGSTTATMFDDSGLSASTTYTYRVWAVASDGTLSDPATVTGTTSAAPVDEESSASYPTWSSTAAYTRGDVVEYGGVVYQAVQSYQGVGDPNWITALALWTPVTDTPAPADSPAPEPTTSPEPEPTVEPEPEPEPEPTVPPTMIPVWDPRGTYAAGDQVTWQGTTYVAVQGYAGYGDPNWITALSLWRPL
ncbi:lytic polysaccharide monooxygenase [Microbacterium sediminicola]|uniref:Lytic polysaccharide monooxygenase n=1 Tax=Microbacterium sediminicola TaxID=415210 RepID=A0ABN2IBJ6_9MICO